MGWCKVSLHLVCLIGFVMVHSSQAQNSRQDYLDAHNVARATLGVGPMTWNRTVARYARKYALSRIGDCDMIHSNGDQYGENLASGSGEFMTGKAAVAAWLEERPNYDYNSNSCVGGECLHYTQVVWNSSIHLGCARVHCNNGWWFVTCNYDPPGNYIGQLPY